MRKIPAEEVEAQLRMEIEAGWDYTRELKRKLREREATIRLIVKGAEAFEEEARRLSDDVPF
jgi:hypothetical protein